MHSVKFLVLFIILFNSNCKKSRQTTPPDNAYGLPNATQTGADIFAYLKDGVPQIVPGGIYSLGGGIRNDTLFITGTAGDSNYFESMGIGLAGNIVAENNYDIDSHTNIIKLDTNKDCTGFLGSSVITAYAISGTIFLSRVDQSNRIISGKFNCRIPIPNCDTLNITVGGSIFVIINIR